MQHGSKGTTYKFLLACAILLTCALFTIPKASAQSVQAQINGTVTDPSGKVVSGAEIVAKNLDNGAEYKTVSSSSGVYFLPSVTPGRYTLKVTETGFQSLVVPEVDLSVNEARTVDAQLTIGAVVQQVEVQASAVALNTTTANIGTVIGHQDIVDIPLNGRNFTGLIMLSPGAVPVQASQQNSFIITGGISPSVNGIRPQMNNFTMDGAENNQRFSNSYAEYPPPDAISEFKVDSHETGADVSLAAGANVNLVTRSGTNNIHGAAWEFVRNNHLAANGFFNNYFGTHILPYRQNQFGYFLGGPVLIPKVFDGRKTRTFFSSYYEGIRYSRASATTATVPDMLERGGNFSELLGTTKIGTDCNGNSVFAGELYSIASANSAATPACAIGYSRTALPNNTVANVNPVAAAYLQYYYPLPNAVGTPNLILDQTATHTSDQFGERMDHSLSDNQQIYGRVSHYNWVQQNPGALPGNPADQQNHGTQAVLHYTRTFSPTFLMDLMFGYNRSGVPDYNPALTGSNGAAFDQAVGPLFYNQFTVGGKVPASQGLTGSRFNGISWISYELANPDSTFQYNGDFKKILGRHEMSFGTHYERYRHIASDQGAEQFGYTPQTSGLPGFSTTGEALASFMEGYPTTTATAIAPYFDDWGNIYNAYFGDSFKATSKLTVNVGLQYVYASPPLVDQNGYKNGISLFDWYAAVTQPAATNFTYAWIWCSTNPITGAAANSQYCPAIEQSNHRDFAPRFGIAYSPFKDTVIRTGFGIFYDFNSNIEQNSIRVSQGNWPYSTSVSYNGQNQTTLGAITLANPFPVPPVGPPPNSAQSISRSNKDPYVMEWNFGIERLLPGAMKLSVDYVASAGRDLIVEYDQNEAVPGTTPIAGRRPVQNVGVFPWRHNDGNGSYNSLQLKLERTFKAGFTLMNSFTYSKSLDVQCDENSLMNSPGYTYDRQLSKGPSCFNIPLNNVTSFVYDLPFGRGKKFGSGMSRLEDYIVGGWESSGILTIRSGLPFNPVDGQDVAGVGTDSHQTPNKVGSPYGNWTRTQHAWFNPAAFTLPAVGSLGNTAPDSLLGPAFQNLDFALLKNFEITEGLKLQLRAEGFNILNITQFYNPGQALSGTSNSTTNSLAVPATFGEILAAYPAREVQFALKLLW